MLLKPQSIKLQFIFSAIFLVLWVLWRVVLIYIEPLNSDEIFALYNGKTMIENGLFFGYTDIKIGWAYFSGVIYKLIGFSPFGYRFIGILITIFTAYLIGLVAKNIFGKDYQIIAFVFYLFFSGMYLLQVHYITAELFQNVFFVLLVVSILRKNKNYFFIGFLIFCVGLIRPASFFDVVMLFLWLRVSTRWRDNIDIRGYYQIIIGVFLSLAVLIIYLIWIDRLSELLNYVSIMRNYTSSSDGSREEYLRLFIDRNFLPLAWVYVFPLMGLLFGVKNFKAISLPLFLLIGSMIDFNSPGYYFPHYQQVLFPALALFSAYGLRQLYIILPDKMKTTAIVVISGLFLVIAYFNNVSIVFGKIKSYSEQHDSTYVDALMYYSKDGGGDRHLIRDDIMKNGGEKNNIFAWSDSQYYHVSIPISHVYGNITFRDEVLPSKLQYKTHRGYLKGTNPQKKLTELVNELTNDMPDYVVIEYSPEQTANDSLEARELFGLFANSYDFTMATYGNLLLSRNTINNDFKFLNDSLIFSPSVLLTLFNIEKITDSGLYHTIIVTPRVSSSKKNYEVKIENPSSLEYVRKLNEKMNSNYCVYQNNATDYKLGILKLECNSSNIIYISSAIGHDEWHSRENGYTKVLKYVVNNKGQVTIDYQNPIHKPKKLNIYFSNGGVWTYDFKDNH